MSESFDVLETTIGAVHDRMQRGELTSTALVERYIDRIEAYDIDGPALNAIVTVNDDAPERAAGLDRQLAEDGFVGPLHGVPVLLKDQITTEGLRTTFGSEAFSEFVPRSDATIVRNLRDAGAVVLAKTNLPDWAAGFVGYSSVLGQTKNPYALDRDSGGSSAGAGVGVAANLGLVGVGEDTGGSIRVPASCCNLFGLRPTTGLVSRSGLSPLVERQDTAGPMARTVPDLARLFDALVGFDPDDRATGATARAPAVPYRDTLDDGGLDGARLGVLRELFGSSEDPAAAPVNAVTERAFETLERAGAELVDPVSIPDLGERIAETSLYAFQSKRDIDAFLSELAGSPVESITEIYESGAYHEMLELIETIVACPDDPEDRPSYWRRVATQEAFENAIAHVFARHDLDAMVFPDAQVVPPVSEGYHTGETDRSDYPTNTVVASQSGCPAVSMPAGFTDEGLPVGVELLGVPYSEPQLLQLARGFERASDSRRPPAVAPELQS